MPAAAIAVSAVASGHCKSPGSHTHHSMDPGACADGCHQSDGLLQGNLMDASARKPQNVRIHVRGTVLELNNQCLQHHSRTFRFLLQQDMDLSFVPIDNFTPSAFLMWCKYIYSPAEWRDASQCLELYQLADYLDCPELMDQLQEYALQCSHTVMTASNGALVLQWIAIACGLAPHASLDDLQLPAEWGTWVLKLASNFEHLAQHVQHLQHLPSDLLTDVMAEMTRVHWERAQGLAFTIHQLLQTRTGWATCKKQDCLEGQKLQIYHFFCDAPNCHGHKLRKIEAVPAFSSNTLIKLSGSWHCTEQNVQQNPFAEDNHVWREKLGELVFEVIREAANTESPLSASHVPAPLPAAHPASELHIAAAEQMQAFEALTEMEQQRLQQSLAHNIQRVLQQQSNTMLQGQYIETVQQRFDNTLHTMQQQTLTSMEPQQNNVVPLRNSPYVAVPPSPQERRPSATEQRNAVSLLPMQLHTYPLQYQAPPARHPTQLTQHAYPPHSRAALHLQNFLAASKLPSTEQDKHAWASQIAKDYRRSQYCPELSQPPKDVLALALAKLADMHRLQSIEQEEKLQHLAQTRTGVATCKVYRQVDGSEILVYSFFCDKANCTGHRLRRIISGVAPANGVIIEGSWHCCKPHVHHECLAKDEVWPGKLDQMLFHVIELGEAAIELGEVSETSDCKFVRTAVMGSDSKYINMVDEAILEHPVIATAATGSPTRAFAGSESWNNLAMACTVEANEAACPRPIGIIVGDKAIAQGCRGFISPNSNRAENSGGLLSSMFKERIICRPQGLYDWEYLLYLEGVQQGVYLPR